MVCLTIIAGHGKKLARDKQVHMFGGNNLEDWLY
jgi:hypothetical protein